MQLSAGPRCLLLRAGHLVRQSSAAVHATLPVCVAELTVLLCVRALKALCRARPPAIRRRLSHLRWCVALLRVGAACTACADSLPPCADVWAAAAVRAAADGLGRFAGAAACSAARGSPARSERLGDAHRRRRAHVLLQHQHQGDQLGGAWPRAVLAARLR